MNEDAHSPMTFWDHLEVLRGVIWRCVVAVILVAVTLFVAKEPLFDMILAPCSPDFPTYRGLDELSRILLGEHKNFFGDFHLHLISTELSAQFSAHLQVALMGGFLLALPYLLWQIFKFVAPALYQNEYRFARIIFPVTYLLFAFGCLLNYYIIFPIALHFLGSYQVSPEVTSTITLSSYISTFSCLMLTMGCVFELPIAIRLLHKVGLISAQTLRNYRRHALVAIMIVSAIITPPDIFSMLLVTLPLYMLYEVSIYFIRK